MQSGRETPFTFQNWGGYTLTKNILPHTLDQITNNYKPRFTKTLGLVKSRAKNKDNRINITQTKGLILKTYLGFY